MAAEIVSASRDWQAKPAPRRDAVRLVVEASGKTSARSRTVVLRRSSEWIAATPLVLCEPTIGRLAMRMCFSGPPRSGCRAHAPAVAGEPSAYVVEQPAVDLVDDLELARDEELHQVGRPALERLGQERVVGIGERPPVRSNASSQPR